MTSTTLNFGKTLTLQQTSNLIMSVPDNIICAQGEPAIGKSAMMNYMKQQLMGYHFAYVDVPNLDLGDIAMPCVDKDNMITNYAPNSLFGMHLDSPVVIMLDEYAKGADPVKNMLHPLFEVKQRRLGNRLLPPGSIVFMTSNLSSDGVGDSLKAHTMSRITRVVVRKPNAYEWLEWAVNNDIDPVVCAWVKAYPHCLDSYLDDNTKNKSNPYIFYPNQVQSSYVSPRSLERGSNIIKKREALDSDTVIAALAGTFGESAARDMSAYISYQDQLPMWEQIVKDPKGTKMPSSAGACSVLVYGAIMKVDKNTIAPFMQYLSRFEAEWQAAFAINITKNQAKQSIAFSCKAFSDWVSKNEDLL